MEFCSDAQGTPASFAVVDLTGGAPEMNPGFRRLVAELRRRGLDVLDRCNLTILLEPGYERLQPPVDDHQHCFGCTAGAGSSCTGALA